MIKMYPDNQFIKKSYIGVLGKDSFPTSEQITLHKKQHIRNLCGIGSPIPSQSLVRGTS